MSGTALGGTGGTVTYEAVLVAQGRRRDCKSGDAVMYSQASAGNKLYATLNPVTPGATTTRSSSTSCGRESRATPRTPLTCSTTTLRRTTASPQPVAHDVDVRQRHASGSGRDPFDLGGDHAGYARRCAGLTPPACCRAPTSQGEATRRGSTRTIDGGRGMGRARPGERRADQASSPAERLASTRCMRLCASCSAASASAFRPSIRASRSSVNRA